MPLWDFTCPECHNTVELSFVSWVESARAKLTCPDCGIALERQPAKTSFILKGKGFHKNDYPSGH
jgi:putative FmdB family regulatory protein